MEVHEGAGEDDVGDKDGFEAGVAFSLFELADLLEAFNVLVGMKRGQEGSEELVWGAVEKVVVAR